MFSIFKKILFWRYGRTTWQYDILCVLILAFIFLTPHSWFANREVKAIGGTGRLVVVSLDANGNRHLFLPAAPQDQGGTPTREDVEKRAIAATGDPALRVKDYRAVRGQDGSVVGFEVDIE